MNRASDSAPSSDRRDAAATAGPGGPVPEGRRRGRLLRLRRAAWAAVTSALALAALQSARDAQGDPERRTPRGDMGIVYGTEDFASGLSPWFVGDPRWTPDRVQSGAAGTAAEGAPSRANVGPFPVTVHLDVPAGTLAAFALRRVSGSFPEVLWVQDAEGRVWTPSMEWRGRYAVSEEIAVASEGGLDVVLSPTRTPRAVVEVGVATRPGGTPGNGYFGAAQTPWCPGRVVAPVATAEDAQALADLLGVAVIEVRGGYAVLGTPGGRLGMEWLDAGAMASVAGFAYGIEPDAYADLPETSQRNQLIVGSEFGRSYPRQPALKMIAAPPPHLRPDASGVTIAVLDTGIDATHPVFEGRLLPGADLVDGDDDPSETSNGLDEDLDGEADDGFGHGTVVAGIALCVAPGAKVLPVRVLDDEGRGTASRVAEGIRLAVDRGADIINMSLGTRTWSGILEDAVQYARAHGVLVVVAAGNDGDRWSLDFPADVPGVLAVTALGLRGNLTRFGNGRFRTAVAAPGVHVIGPYPGGTWAAGRGTSFAAPVAAGAAALLRAARPEVALNVATFRGSVVLRGRVDVRRLRLAGERRAPPAASSGGE